MFTTKTFPEWLDDRGWNFLGTLLSGWPYWTVSGAFSLLLLYIAARPLPAMTVEPPAAEPPPVFERTPAVIAPTIVPELAVAAHSGSEAILLVSNTGGDCVVTATCRFLSVSRGALTHSAPFLGNWKDTTTHQWLEGHHAPLAKRSSVKLLVAEFSTDGFSTYSLKFFGDADFVTAVGFEPYESSPTFVLEVRITSEPPVNASLLRVYEVFSERESGIVTLKPRPTERAKRKAAAPEP